MLISRFYIKCTGDCTLCMEQFMLYVCKINVYLNSDWTSVYERKPSKSLEVVDPLSV